jgi:hypothetical protein
LGGYPSYGRSKYLLGVGEFSDRTDDDCRVDSLFVIEEHIAILVKITKSGVFNRDKDRRSVDA